MNKIFKVIFNKTTGQFVVVSELSKAKGKASSSTDERVGVSSLVTKLQYQAKAALILGLLGVSSVAYAAAPTYGDNDGIGSPIAIGTGSNASGEANIALGENSSATDTSKKRKQMIAIGVKASVTGSQAIAIGGETAASGFGSIAIGGDDVDGLSEYRELRYNPTSGKVENRGGESAYQGTTASGVGSISIGPKSQSLQNGTVAVGVLATAAGIESVSIGVKSASKGASAVALGAGSTALANNSVAIGNKAVAESDGGVALGKDSIANITAGSKGYDVSTNAETTETNSTWKATHAAVSVGKADGTITRQIKGVAAGSNDTDAVNVAQLKKVTLKVAGNSGSGSVALASQTLTLEGQNGIVASAAGQKVTIKLDDDTKTQINNALSKTDASNTYVTKTSAANYATKTELNGKAAGTNTFKFKIQDGAATATDAKTWTLSTSDTVTFKAGDNLDVSAANGVITYSLDSATKTSINSIASKVNTSDFNTYKTEVTTALSGKADTGLSNLTNAGNTVIKNQAKQAINVVGTGKVNVQKDTTTTTGVDTYKVSVDVSDLATKTEVGAKLDSSAFTNENVTSKVNTGSLTSTTLTVNGAGKVVGGDLTVNLKNGAIDTAHLSTAVQNSITNAKTKVAVNPASGGILKLDTSTDTTQPTTYTLSIDEAKLKEKAGTTNLATEYAKADASNINGNNLANWKTKLNEGASLSNPSGALVKDSDLTSDALTGRISKGNVVSGSTGLLSVAGGEGKVFGSNVTISLTDDATNKINNALSESKAAETYARKDATGLSEDNKTAWKTALGVSNLDLNYKAGNESTAKTTTLSQGLHFKGEGLTITTAASGVVNFAIADNAITKAKLADNAVGTAEIEAKAVTKAKLADDVTNEIADKADKRLSNLEDAGKAVVTGLVAATGGDGITVDAKVDDTSKVKTFTVGLDDTTKGKIAKIAAGEVATSDENTVTGAKVHTAITSAKTKVKLADGSSTSLTLNKVESTDLTANEYTLKLDKEALKTELGVANLDLYYQGNANDTKQNTTLSNGLKFTSDDLTVTAKTGGEVNFTLKNDAVETANIKDSAVTKAKLAEEVKTEIANAKTVVSLDTSGSNALELTPSTTTGPTTYTLKLNETKLNQSAKLSYKANGDATAATAKEIALSTGLNFNSASTDALTIGTEADGKVNFTINTGAFADTGLAAKNGDSNKVATVGGVAGAISAVNTALTTSINTKANKDLNDISNAGKEVITGLTEVVKDTDTARLGTTTNLAEVTKVVDNANKTETFHVLVKESAVKTALNDDFAAKDATNLGDTDVSAWKTKLGVSDLTATKLKYKGNDNVATKETSLATGLTFASEDLTITAGDNGALNFALKAGAVDESNLESTLATKINNKVDNTRKLTFNTQNSADATKTSAGEWTLSSDDNVNFKAGDGLKVSGTGKEITYDLSDAHKTTLARVGAGSVADNDNNTVTGNTVFDAIESAKTSLTTGGMTFAGDVQNNKTSKVSLGSTLTVEGEGTEPTTTAANNIAVEADGSNKLTVKLAENLSNIKTIHLKGQNGKDGKIGVDANGDVTVTNGIDGTNGTGGEASKIVTEKTIGNQTIAYRANEGTADADKEKTVKLSKGFTFKGDANVKAGIGDDGAVTYSLNPVLTGITSIAGSGTTATFGTDGIALNSKKITGLTNGATTSSSNEAVTGAQLYGVANNVKGILGSSIAIDTNGGLTATNIGNSGKNNVHEAIAASREEVAITGDVLTLTPSKTTDGANKYTLGINATKLNETAILKYKANGDGTAAAPKETALSTGLEFVSQDTDQLAITTENSGKVKFDLLTGAINVDTATKTISVVAADNNKLTTAKNVADAINAAKSSLTTSGFDVSATTAEATGNNKVTHQLTKELAIVGKDSNLATTVAQDGNGKTTVKVGLNSTLTNMSSIGFGANAPVLSSTGLDMNDKAITDLASGLGSKDIAAADGSANALTADDKKNAVNVGDLQSVYNKLKENTDNLANTSLTFRGDETGDDKKVDRKLGETLTLKGGADTTDSKLTSGNIAVVKDTATGANGLVVKLAKELTALTSATFGSGDNSAVLDADSLTFKAKGEAADATVKTLTISNDKTKGGSITGLEVRNVESENYGTGNNETRAATESAVKEVSDRVNKAADGTTGVVVYTDQDGKRIVKDNGQFYLTKADGTADKTKPAVPEDKVLVSIVNPNKLSDKQAVGNANKLANLAKGTVSTTSTEAITGAQLHDLVTHVGLTPNDTKTGFNALSFDAITASVASGSAVARTDLVNAVKDIIIAVNKGTVTQGDNNSSVTRQLGQTLKLNGGATGTLSDNNIGVVVNDQTNADGFNIKLAKDLKNLASAEFVGTGDNAEKTTLSSTGMKVETVDGNNKAEATYGKDGLTVKGADGNDAISLTNKTDANNTTTPALEFAKGADGKGTGAISGLKDIDPSDTDGSKATNKNYVDSRIADLDAGKPFEYFDNQGNKVVRGKDNQFYKATDIDGKVYVEGKGYVLPADKDNQNAKGVEAVKSGDVVIKAMPNSDQPMGLSNIRSGLGLSPITETKDNQTVETAITKEAAQTAVDSLVTQTGSGLNNAATVRDLQALAQAGVDFTGNNAAENKDVHRPLGTKLTIEGEATTANQTKAQFGESAADNIHVEAKGAENKLVVSLSKDLKNLKTVTASDSIQVGTDANGVKITPDATTTTKTEGTGADKKVTTVTAGADGTSIVQKDANDQPLKSAEYKLDGSKVDDGKGNTTEVKASGLTAKDANSTTKVDANGMDVKSDDPNDKSAATYGKDGLTVKGNDGKDAISLTSTTAGGKTTNTLALNGKDGKDAVSITSGVDGAAPEISFAKNGEDGTGSITGLKDVERNPDGTAKDKTQAANAGYVDDRLKEMNEGKPFEYFEKDPVTGEVKTETVDGKQVPVTLVRGKDGKFYKESDLKGKVFDPATNTYKNADGTPATLTEVASNNVTVQAMPSPTGKPLEMGNVGSGLGLDDSTTTNATALTPEQAQTAIAGSGKDGKGGLLTKTGSSLNNVATVKDLQALAQAGLDFVGNETTTTAVHRPLGTKLVVQGETDAVNQTLTQFGATAKDNIYVDTDATNNKLVVKMTEDLKNINSLTTKPVDNPDGTKTSTKLTSTGTVVSKVDPAKLDADGKPTPVETANYGLTTELKKTDADGKVTTSTSAPTGTTLSEADKNGNKLREAEYDLDGTKVTLKDPVTGATKEISTGVDGTKVTSKDPATGVTKETTTGVDGTTVKVTDQNNPNNNKSAEYGVDGTALKAKDAQGNDISADYKVGGATVKDKDNTTEIKPDGMTVKSTDESDKSEAKYGKDGLSIVGPKGKDGKDGISLGYKPDTDANGQLTGTSTPTLAFGKGEKDPDGNDKGTGSITGLKDVERNPDGSAKDRTAAANAGYVDERLAEANATKPLGYFGTDGKKLVLGQDGKFYKPEDLEGKVYVKRKDGTEGYFNSEEKDNPTAKPVDLKNKAVDPQTVTIKAMPSDASNTPITMSNVGSGLGLKDDAESNKTALTPADAQKAIAGDNKDGKGGLLAQTGNALNNVATVKDLQAIAQAGLDFTGNNTATTVHRPLGTKLTVEGEGKWNGKDSAANNLYVEAQEADNKLVVKMNKDLTNLNSVTLGTATMTGDKNTINLTGAGAQVVEEFVKWDPVTKQPIRDKDGNLQKYKEKVDPRVKLSGIADGDISPNSTDAVNGRQVYALTNGNQVEQKKDGSTATYAKNKDGSVITEVKRDKSGNPVVDADGNEIVQAKEYTLTTYNVEGQTEFVTNSVITAVHNMNEQGIKFFHTNDGVAEPINQASNGIDSSASGTYATAVGYKAVAAGDNALAMGKGATASGKNSIAIGTGNQVIANKSGAFGDPNIIRGVQIGTDSAGNPIYKGIDGSYAFGNDNVITSSNTFVLGNNVNNKRDSNGALTWMSAIPEGTVENSVYLGNNTTATAGDGSQTGSLKNWKQDGSRGSTTTAGSTGTVSSATVGNMIYGGFAGATANGVVSVGAAGDERRIQNVAAGEISSTSTDAINGSQLYNVAHRLGAKLESEGRQLRAGIAATTAMSNIPQVTLPGKSTLGAGIGTFEGQNAVAVGFSRMSDNGRVILKVSAGATSQGKYNAGAGIALQW
ncbi:YadA-like family protein [Glaesserella parasuis]|uniref:YadA-like family protein n=1 Tax=Glaesserella parasuis TaxID=738 RepID=UPI0024373E51|nr:YadA-like family protein [Glaesserella parasuis]MDG6449532.1 YadA-like family protein [Glaesserella parasuis]MDO9790419.1 YadA-like family protein [Glaesserella parasuis]